MSISTHKLNLKSIGLISFAILLIAFGQFFAVFIPSLIAIGTGNFSVLTYASIQQNVSWAQWISPIVGIVLISALLIRSKGKINYHLTKMQFIKTSTFFALLIAFSMIASTPLTQASTTAVSGYILDSPFSGFSYYVGAYSNGNYYAINGSNWDNMVAGVGSTAWAAYTTNLTKLTELSLMATTSGVIYLKDVQFPLTLMGSIPSHVSVVCSYQGVSYTYINSANSLGSPYTVSVGSGVNNGYYMAQDSGDRFCFASTNKNTVLAYACTSGSSVTVTSGNYGSDAFVAVPNNCTLTINPGATNITYLVGYTANINDYQKNAFYREGTNILAPTYGNGKRVFTWNSCDPVYINSTMLNFLKNQYITDVVVTTQNLTVATMQSEAFKYMQWGYPVWWVVSVWQDSGYLSYTESQWAVKFSQWLAEAPNGRLYLDDMQILATTERCNAFLNAVRTVQTFNSQNESNIIVDSYVPQINTIAGINRANIDYDLYTNMNNSYTDNTVSTGAKSVGAYIWGFTPFFKYDRNLFNHITDQYADIITMDYSRLTVWAGFWQEDYHWQCYDEDTDQPVVKAESQLYCNPTLWTFIAQKTATFLELQTTGWHGSNLQEGLQLYLPLDDAVSGSADGQYAIDWSGNRRNSNITGGTWTWNAAYGKALYVDGAGTPIDNIATSNMQINKNSQLSVSMWIYPISNTTSQTLVGQTNGGNGWLLNLYNGGLRFFSDTAVTMYDITFTQDIQAEKWTFIAMTWNDYTGTVLFYVYSADGTTSEWTTLSIAPHQIRTDLDRTVFGNYQGSLFGYNGIYDEIRFWNIALTSRDICNIYNQGPLIHGVSGAP